MRTNEKEIKELDLKIKLVQLEKLNGALVKKERVAEQFALFYNLLWANIDEIIINFANSISQRYNANFDAIVAEMRGMFYDLKKTIEEGRLD